MGKVLKKASRVIRKVIPKEIRPALPALAAIFGPAALGSMGSFGAAFSKLPAFAQAALVNAATQGAIEGKIDPKQAAIAGATAQLGSSLSKYGGTTAVPSSQMTKTALSSPEAMKAALAQTSGPTGTGIAGQSFLRGVAEKTGSFLSPQYVDTGDKAKDVLSYAYSGTKAALPTITYATGEKLKELQQDELDRYNQQLQDQGIRDKAERRQSIFNIYTGSGYDPEYVNSVLDKYGYAEGGRVEGIMSISPKVMKGMSLGDLADLAKRIKDAEEAKKRESKRQGGRVGFKLGGGEFSLISVLLDRINPDTGEKYTPEEAEEVVSGMRGVDTSDIMQGIQGIQSGFETAMGEPIFGQKPQPMGIVPGFGNLPRMEEGGMVEDAAYNIWKKMYEKNPDVAMMHERSEEYLKKYQGEAVGKADGGLMNLRAGGMPAEMDMRGGGFIPIGRKERADDVPARLSKNEFVMTADAVRGAGGGSIEKGAKRMYQTMKRLEAKS